MAHERVIVRPIPPAGTAAEHQRWIELDAEFGTDPMSPLHHDQRCEACRVGTLGR